MIRKITENDRQAAGSHRILWDGRDDAGNIAPDEAYTFRLDGEKTGKHDPATFSGGEVRDITDVNFNPAGPVTYNLPQPSRVLFRIGITQGPLLKTLVDSKPRPGGKITEYWDGYDESKTVKIRDEGKFSALITYVTLPDLTVIAYGNSAETYRDYKLTRQANTAPPPEPASPSKVTEDSYSPSLVPPAWVRAPRVTMRFPDHAKNDTQNPAPITDAIRSTIDVDDSDRSTLMEGQFEIMMYVDMHPVAEAERGYLPLNWRWDLSLFPPGDHVLTANVITFDGQSGTVSRKVRIVREEQ